MSLEDEMRRQMEIAASQQASGYVEPECVQGEDVDAVFGLLGGIKRVAKKVGGAVKGLFRNKMHSMSREQVAEHYRNRANKAGAKFGKYFPPPGGGSRRRGG